MNVNPSHIQFEIQALKKSSCKPLFVLFFILFFQPFCISQTTYNWEELFYQSYYLGYKNKPPLKKFWFNLSNSDNVVDLQPLSYGLDAMLAMYETTDSLRYLDDAISLSVNVIDSSEPSDRIPNNLSNFQDKFRGWIERTHTEPGVYFKETVLSEIYFFQYVTRLLKDIHDDNSLMQNSQYSKFYFQTLNFVEVNIWDKWVDRGKRVKNKDAYLLLARTHMASHWAYIAAELSFLTTNETRKVDYLDFVNLFNSQLEKNFQRYGNYIWWNSTWNGTNNAAAVIQDVSHANLVVSYIVEAYSLGLWTDFDAIQRIINTLKDKLWNAQDCIFRDNIDGTMFPAGYTGSVGSFQADGFVKLTRYDKSLFAIYQNFVGCSKYLTAWMQYGQLFANLALSKKMLEGM